MRTLSVPMAGAAGSTRDSRVRPPVVEPADRSLVARRVERSPEAARPPVPRSHQGGEPITIHGPRIGDGALDRRDLAVEVLLGIGRATGTLFHCLRKQQITA